MASWYPKYLQGEKIMKKSKLFFGFLWLIALILIVFVSLIKGFREVHFLCFLKNWIPFADKAAHLVAYMFMAFTVTLFFRKRKLWGVYSALALCFLGTVLEIGQIYVAGRTFSIMDLIANVAGVIIGFSLAWIVISLLWKKQIPAE